MEIPDNLKTIDSGIKCARLQSDESNQRGIKNIWGLQT